MTVREFLELCQEHYVQVEISVGSHTLRAPIVRAELIESLARSLCAGLDPEHHLDARLEDGYLVIPSRGGVSTHVSDLS